MSGREAVDVLHGCTLHGDEPVDPARLMRFRPLDPRNRPAPLKRYPGISPEPLPRDLRRSTVPASEVLSGHGAPPRTGPVDRDLLGTLLFLAAGVTRAAPTARGDHVWFRSAMSAGNLHPVEVYVVGDDVHHYQPLEHALVPLRRAVAAGAGVHLVLTGIPFRTCWKYGERGWRHLWWDAGAMLANLLTAAAAHGVDARIDLGFVDTAVAELVGVDGVDEMPLAVVRLGDGELEVPPADALAPLGAPTEPVAAQVLRFPLVVEAQRATELADAGEVAGWRAAAADVARDAPARVDPPAGDRGDQRAEDVILRRGSTRLFERRTAPFSLLEWGLGAACRSGGLDVAPGATLLEQLVNVHDVDGAEAGGYRYTPTAGFEGRTRIDQPRAAGERLCLDQPLGGDSAFTVFHAAALGPLMDALGGRGYRAAQLEAGLVAGRLALNAVAQGGGATGLTFYDRLVSRYFRTEAAAMLATAVGIPETRPAPSGRPGEPAELGGYGHVMERVAAGLRR